MRRSGLGLCVFHVLFLATIGVGLAQEEPTTIAPDVALFKAGQAAPPYRMLGIVYDHRWSLPGRSVPEWQPVYDSIAFQARALGADMVVQATSGEDDPLIEEGGVKWFLGIAASTIGIAADSLGDCDNCIVDWMPINSSAAVADDPEKLALFEQKAFAISRLRLGEQGYYLRNRPGADSSAVLLPEDAGRSNLSLEVAVRRGEAAGGSGQPEGFAFAARLSWKASGATAWERSNKMTSTSGVFDYASGAEGIESRNMLTGLYSNLQTRGPTPDSDGDGIPDSIDREAETPEGAEVTQFGVALDDDGDGVSNGIDRDPNTMRGVMVDQYGVPVDLDHDGVADYIDDCLDTEADLVVDEHGCPIEEWITFLEDELVDEGLLRERFHFALGSAELQAEALARLDSIGVAMSGLLGLRFSVEGHCDDQGSEEYNRILSLRRAEASISYLIREFDSLSRQQFKAKGLGKSKPLRIGTDEESRALNRRVEFIVENPEEAKRQVEKKRFKRRGGS